ncbi:hypothetical protein UFOVP814_42 [uncultured Caudovirales phage]|uniref:Uncharacterized protein n=1 Tax=uncultured Caudovirales phage TaxID=2100421 RepID=A0A6J5NVU9_9CAUD|nr:hypothetical protein UFOVP814_42 [uncultured Caudovirales phage]
MSLELAINENTQAVKALAELMLKLTSGAVQVTTQTIEAAKSATPKAEAKAETKDAKTEAKAEAKAAKVEAKTEAAPAQVKTDTAAVTYDDVKKAILAYQTANGREATINALNSFGAAKGTDLKPEQYAEALALFTA